MSTPTGIDRSAPVIAHHELEPAERMEAKWQVFSRSGWRPAACA
jgi:hypothetical protein